MLDRKIPPIISSGVQIDFPKVEFYNTDNGVKIYSLTAGSQPVIKVEALFPHGGNYYENITASSLLSLQMLREGTKQFLSTDISNQLAKYGAFLEVSPSFDVPSISLYCLSKHLKSVLPHFQEMLTAPTFPETEFEILKQLQIENLKAQSKKNAVVATKEFRKLIFGPDHPYGRQLTEDLIKNLRIDQVAKFYRNNLTHFELLISGQLDKKVLKDLSLYFNDSPQSGPKRLVKDSFIPNDKIFNVRKPDTNALQSSIRMGKRMVSKCHDDYIPVLVVNHILGGYFGSRLMKNIREDKGFTYGVHSSIVALQHSSYLSISADVIKTHADEAVSEINKELHTLVSELVSDKELTIVKNHLIGSFQSQLNSPFSLMSKFKQVHIHNLDYSYYDKYLAVVKNITPHEIKSIAREYFQPAQMKQVIIG